MRLQFCLGVQKRFDDGVEKNSSPLQVNTVNYQAHTQRHSTKSGPPGRAAKSERFMAPFTSGSAARTHRIVKSRRL